jgi:hypothetical protein
VIVVMIPKLTHKPCDHRYNIGITQWKGNEKKGRKTNLQ